MGRNEDFDNALWSQPRFEELSPLASLFYIWSWTNPHCGMAGLYEVGRRTMTQSKIEECELDGVIAELERAWWLHYQYGVLLVVARVKRLRRHTSQIAVSIARDVAAITEGHPLRVAWLRRYGDAGWLKDALADHGINPVEKPDLVKFNRTSFEVPLSGTGLIEPTGKARSSEKVDARDGQIGELFAYWQDRCGHNGTLLTDDRRRKIAARLREGYTPGQVREAIDGAAVGAVRRGKKRFDDIALICRSGEKLESFIGREGPPVEDPQTSPPSSPRDERKQRNAEVLRRVMGAADVGG